MPQKTGTFFVQGEKIVLKKDGTWFADGVEITHDQTRELFGRSIHWDPQARRFCLKIGYETMYIEVEDTPFFVKALEKADRVAVLSDERRIELNAARLRYEKEALYLELDDGLRAKFLSAPYYQLLKHLEEDGASYFLTIAGQKATLSPKTPGGGGSRPGGQGQP